MAETTLNENALGSSGSKEFQLLNSLGYTCSQIWTADWTENK